MVSSATDRSQSWDNGVAAAAGVCRSTAVALAHSCHNHLILRGNVLRRPARRRHQQAGTALDLCELPGRRPVGQARRLRGRILIEPAAILRPLLLERTTGRPGGWHGCATALLVSRATVNVGGHRLIDLAKLLEPATRAGGSHLLPKALAHVTAQMDVAFKAIHPATRHRRQRLVSLGVGDDLGEAEIVHDGCTAKTIRPLSSPADARQRFTASRESSWASLGQSWRLT